MTRVNVVPVTELTDQHLIAEFREIPRIFTYIEQHMIPKGKEYTGPAEYTLNSGHMKFFSNKAGYIFNRMIQLYIEGKHNRKFNLNFDMGVWTERYLAMPEQYCKLYSVTEEALRLNRERLQEKLDMRPDFYRMHGKKISDYTYERKAA